MKIEAASHSILAHVRTILTQAGLPTAGLDDQFPGGYVVAVESDEVAGCAGLEIYGRYGLVRSLAVNSRYQRAGVGRALVANRIAAARLLELASVYLLTTSAPDRQPAGQYMVAPDDIDPNRVFLVYVDANSGDGNDDIRISESKDGGATWTAATGPSGNLLSLNSVHAGDRFLPWLCASASDPTNSGTPTISSDLTMSGLSRFDDLQCASGFFPDIGAAARDPAEETLCGQSLPANEFVFAGMCEPSNASGESTVCDFRFPNSCLSGQTCTVGDGAPKYGDYNMAACARGQLFAAWTSAVPPQGVVCRQAGGACSTDADCCNGAPCSGGGFCTPAAVLNADNGACLPDGAICSETFVGVLNTCCSDNCLAGTCQPGVNVYASSSAVSTAIGRFNACTNETADLPPETTPFTVDTGLPPLSATIGSNYGQPSCPNELMIEVELNQGSLVGRDFFVSGAWTSALAPAQCTGLQATMTVYGLPTGVNPLWQLVDTVQYANLSANNCTSVATSHTDPAFAGSQNVKVQPGTFQRLRIAMSATQTTAGTPVFVPVEVSGQTLSPGVVVTISDLSFQTTGFNLGNCETPVNRETGTFTAMNSAGDLVIHCFPIIDPNGQLDTQQVTAGGSGEVSCTSDNNGAVVDVTCSGTGLANDESISVTVTSAIEDTCQGGPDTSTENPPLIFPNVTPGEGSAIEMDPIQCPTGCSSPGGFVTQACGVLTFHGVCATTPCNYDDFMGLVNVSYMTGF